MKGDGYRMLAGRRNTFELGMAAPLADRMLPRF